MIVSKIFRMQVKFLIDIRALKRYNLNRFREGR